MLLLSWELHGALSFLTSNFLFDNSRAEIVDPHRMNNSISFSNEKSILSIHNFFLTNVLFLSELHLIMVNSILSKKQYVDSWWEFVRKPYMNNYGFPKNKKIFQREAWNIKNLSHRIHLKRKKHQRRIKKLSPPSADSEWPLWNFQMFLNTLDTAIVIVSGTL